MFLKSHKISEYESICLNSWLLGIHASWGPVRGGSGSLAKGGISTMERGKEEGPREEESFPHFCQAEEVGKGVLYRGNSLSRNRCGFQGKGG